MTTSLSTDDLLPFYETLLIPRNLPGDGPGVELVEVIRKLALVEKRLITISAEMDGLRDGEIQLLATFARKHPDRFLACLEMLQAHHSKPFACAGALDRGREFHF